MKGVAPGDLFSPLSLKRPWQMLLCISHRSIAWDESHPVWWREEAADTIDHSCMR